MTMSAPQDCCNAQEAQVQEAPSAQVQHQYHLPTILENLEKDLESKNGLIATLSNDVGIIVNLISKIKEIV
jgi:hypothetical protein